MSADVRLDAATLEHVAKWLKEEMDEAARRYARKWRDAGRESDSRLVDLIEAVQACHAHVANLAAEAASDPSQFSDWIRACEGTGLGEPLNWWDDGLDGLDLAAEWIAAGKRVIAYCGPAGGRYVEVDGEVHTRCSTPADLRAALNRIAAEAVR